MNNNPTTEVLIIWSELLFIDIIYPFGHLVVGYSVPPRMELIEDLSIPSNDV